MIKNFEDFKKQLVKDPKLQEEFKKDPVQAINQVEVKNPLQSDPWIYRIVVGALGFAVITIILGILILFLTDKIEDDKGVPTIFTAIGSAAIGALAGLLAPSARNSKS